MNVGSTFSGVGGLDLGLERAGMRVLWQAEVDEWCRRVLRWHWPDADIDADVCDVSGKVLHKRGRAATSSSSESDKGKRKRGFQAVDLLCGGFPCQDLSVAGKRAGLAGERSGLFFEFARIADELRPNWLIVENVVGLLSSANGRDMGVVLSTLAEIGYGLSWRVVDARFFGVPQRRRRVFIVGCLGDDGERAVRALGAGGEGDLEAGLCSWQNAAGGVGAGAAPGGGIFTEDTAKCLTTSNQRIDSETETFVVANAIGRTSHLPDDNSAQAHHLVKGFHPTQDPIVEEDGTPSLGATSGGMAVSFAQNQRGELRESEVAMQLTTGGGKPGEGYPAVRLPQQTVRRLTPTECERLMGWPDGWTAVDGDKTPDSRRYAACGNGVVSNVAEWIGRRIMAVEREG